LAEIPARLKFFSKTSTPLSIYICTDALLKFAKEVLGAIQTPFVLVSGDSDIPIDYSYLGDAFDQIVKNEYLLAWFAQNKSIEHSKLHSLPIGLDYHSKWVDPKIWGGGLILPALQELEIRKTLKESPLWPQRQPKAYCDWIFALDRGDRNLCKEQIDLSACIFPQGSLSRLMAWQAQSNCAFVISPSGAGIDCHRTWEALALGCVPIVKRNHLSDVFDGLPVIIVDDWRVVTQALLIEKFEAMKGNTFDYSRLFLSYWSDEIHLKSSMASKMPRMTMDQYRQFITQ
jgi:hypothetical protein